MLTLKRSDSIESCGIAVAIVTRINTHGEHRLEYQMKTLVNRRLISRNGVSLRLATQPEANAFRLMSLKQRNVHYPFNPLSGTLS